MIGPPAAWQLRENGQEGPLVKEDLWANEMGIYDQAGQELSGQGERRGLSTLDQSTESPDGSGGPVVWRYIEVMEFFPPKDTLIAQ